MTPTQHIYWFAPYGLNCPSTRYRGYLPLKFMEEQHGLTYNFIYPDRSVKGIFRFLLLWLGVLFFRKTNAVIVIQKVCTNRYYANLLKLLILVRPERTIYDIDDAEYLRTDTKSLHFFLKHCSKVQVGSPALRIYCSDFNENVYINTSPVPLHNYQKRIRNKTTPHIGWVGDLGEDRPDTRSYSHKTSLYQLFFPAIIAINRPLKLSIIGVKNQADIPEIKAHFQAYQHIELDIPENLKWEEDEWVYERIADFDIGVSPMVDAPFNQAKSAFKAKQYLSCGVPVLASDVGENARFVVEGKTGLLCSNVQDFEYALLELINCSDQAYRLFSEQALANRSAYSLEAYTAIFLGLKKERKITSLHKTAHAVQTPVY